MGLILGIDPGSYRCGYGLIELSSTLNLVECGVFQLPHNLAIEQRLRFLAKDVRELVAEYHPQYAAIESIFHGVNAQSALRLGYARGVLLLLFAEAGLTLFEYSPATVKKTIAGHGRASKEEIQRMVAIQCGLATNPPQDAADAVAIALCHARHVLNTGRINL